MQDVISDYYFYAYDAINGRIKPTEEYLKNSAETLGMYNKLKEMLNEEQKELFEKFAEYTAYQEGEATETYFKAGFKYAMRLAVECLEVPL